MAEMSNPIGAVRVEHVAAANAQVALLAASSIYSGARGHVRLAEVKTVAESLLNWLDHQDK